MIVIGFSSDQLRTKLSLVWAARAVAQVEIEKPVVEVTSAGRPLRLKSKVTLWPIRSGAAQAVDGEEAIALARHVPLDQALSVTAKIVSRPLVAVMVLTSKGKVPRSCTAEPEPPKVLRQMRLPPATFSMENSPEERKVGATPCSATVYRPAFKQGQRAVGPEQLALVGLDLDAVLVRAKRREIVDAQRGHLVVEDDLRLVVVEVPLLDRAAGQDVQGPRMRARDELLDGAQGRLDHGRRVGLGTIKVNRPSESVHATSSPTSRPWLSPVFTSIYRRFP